MQQYKVESDSYTYWEDYASKYPALADIPGAKSQIQDNVNAVYAVVLRCFR